MFADGVMAAHEVRESEMMPGISNEHTTAEALVRELVEALEFYASADLYVGERDEDGYTAAMLDDMSEVEGRTSGLWSGKKAREALTKATAWLESARLPSGVSFHPECDIGRARIAAGLPLTLPFKCEPAASQQEAMEE